MGGVTDRLVALSCRLYALVLRALPARVIERDSAAMLGLYRRLASDARRRGVPQLVAVHIAASVDVLVEATRLRAAARRRGEITGEQLSSTAGRAGILDTTLLDLRYAFRSLRRRPLFTGLAVATFGLGIGANTAIFSVVHSVLLRDLGYRAPDRIVRLMGVRRNDVNLQGTLAYLNFRDIHARTDLFEAGSAYDEWRPNLTGGGEPELIDAAQVNASFFDVFGVPAAAGRYFLPLEDEGGHDNVVVLSWGLWQRRYGGDPAMVGSDIILNGNAYTVVGVAPRDFEDPRLSGASWDRPALWRPLGYVGVPEDEQPSRGSTSYVAVARLAPGVTIERAVAELESVSAGLEREFPEENDGVSMTAVPLRESIVGDVRGSLLMLLGAVGFVLAIATANVSNLLLSRATERRQEIAVRSALGASRRRIVRQTLVESVLLAGSGGVVGVLLAVYATRVLGGMAAVFVPRTNALGINAVVLGFAFVVTLAAGVVCGVFPTLLGASADPRTALTESTRGTSGTRRTGRLRRGLVVAEVSLAIVLLVGAGLLGRSFWNLMRVDVGIDTANLLTFDLAPSAATYGDQAALSGLYDDLLSRLRGIPGVESTASVNIAPLTGGFDCNTARLPGREQSPSERICPEVRTMTPGYFETAGVRIVEGREVDETDRAGMPLVAVVTQSLARQLWPGESAIGKQFIMVDKTIEVVGVAADVKHLRLEESSSPMAFVMVSQGIVAWHGRRMTVLLRTRSDPIALASAVRSAVHAVDPQLPVANLRTMESVVNQAAAAPRFRTTLLVSFACLALLLAAIGIYGVVSYSVSQRTRELAIRIALGSRAGGVIRLVLRDGMVPVAVGTGLGLAGAFVVSRVLAAVLFGVTATDGLVFLGVPAVLMTVAAVATLVPARRATRADPMNVLRES